MDLIVDFFSVHGDRKVTEIMLLAHWSENVSLRRTKIERIRDIVERIAYDTIIDDSFSITSQSCRDLVDSQSFEELKKIGWLVPAGYIKGEKRFEFVHKRFQEYLCACYIRTNWEGLHDSLFNRRIGLLSKRSSADIFLLSLLESERIGYNSDVLSEMIYQIAGEDNWYVDGEINLKLLRDPILALLLSKQIGLEDSFFYLQLKEIIEEIWWKLQEEDIPQIKNNLISWLDMYQLKKTIYLVNLQLVMETMHSSSWIGDLEQFDIFDEKIEHLMNIFSKSLIYNLDYTEQFFHLLRYGYTDNQKWKTDVRKFIDHIKENPQLIGEENQKEIDPLTGSRINWMLITKNAFYTLLDIDVSEAEKTIFYFVNSGNKDLELFPVLNFSPDKLGTLKGCYDLFRKWLFNEEESLRFKIINKLFWVSAYCDLNPEKLLTEMHSSLSDEDFGTWLENIELTEFREKENNLKPLEWLKEEREQLLLWLCKNRSFIQLVQDLPIYRCKGLLEKIIKTYEGSVSEDDAIFALNMVLNIFPFKDEEKILTDYLSSMDFGENFVNYKNKLNTLYKLQFEDSVDLAFQCIYDVDYEIRFESMCKIVSKNDVNTNKKLKQILISKKNKDELIKEDLWEIILRDDLDAFEEYIEIGLTSEDIRIVEQFLYKLYHKGRSAEYSKEIQEIIINLLTNTNRDIRIRAALLSEFFPKADFTRYVKKLISSEDADVQAIGLRQYSVSLGLNLHRVIIKGLTSIGFGTVRPLFQQYRLDICDHYSGYETGFVFLSREERYEETRQKTEFLNFGIRAINVSDYIKKYFNENTSKELVAVSNIHIYDKKTMHNLIKFYVNPVVTNKSIEEEDLQIFQKLLNSEEYSKLHLVTLFYLEEVLLLNPEYFSYFEKDFLDLLKANKDKVFAGMVQYLLFRYSDKNDIKELYIDLQNKKILNLQSFWWGIGLRDERNFEDLLLNNMDSWKNNEIFNILSVVLPYSNYSGEILCNLFRKLTSVANEQNVINMCRYSFNTPIDNRLLYLDWIIVTNLGCGEDSFRPSAYQYLEPFQLLQSDLSFKVSLVEENITDLLEIMKNHRSLYFRELNDELNFELGKIKITEYFKALSVHSDIYAFFLFLRHFSLLSKEQKLRLIEIFLKKTSEESKLHRLDNRFSDDSREMVSLHSDNRKIFLSKLVEVKDIRILEILHEIFVQYKDTDSQLYSLAMSEIDIVQDIWKKNSTYLIEEDIHEVFRWLVTLYNLESKHKPYLDGIPSNLLFKISDLLVEGDTNHDNLRNRLFFTLHDKPYYSIGDYWFHLLDNN